MKLELTEREMFEAPIVGACRFWGNFYGLLQIIYHGVPGLVRVHHAQLMFSGYWEGEQPLALAPGEQVEVLGLFPAQPDDSDQRPWAVTGRFITWSDFCKRIDQFLTEMLAETPPEDLWTAYQELRAYFPKIYQFRLKSMHQPMKEITDYMREYRLVHQAPQPAANPPKEKKSEAEKAANRAMNEKQHREKMERFLAQILADLELMKSNQYSKIDQGIDTSPIKRYVLKDPAIFRPHLDKLIEYSNLRLEHASKKMQGAWVWLITYLQSLPPYEPEQAAEETPAEEE